MIISSHKQPKASNKLINYLQQKVGLTDDALNLGLRQSELEQAPLPIILWTYGLITIEQLDNIIQFQSNIK